MQTGRKIPVRAEHEPEKTQEVAHGVGRGGKPRGGGREHCHDGSLRQGEK